MLSTHDAATHLGVAVRTIQMWIKQGKLPATRMGRDWFIAEQDVAAFKQPPMGRPRKDQQERKERI